MSIRLVSALIVVSLVVSGFSVPTRGQDPAEATPPTDLLAPEAATSVAARLALLEGPAFDGRGSVFFSDIAGNRIYLKRRRASSLSSPTAGGPTATSSTAGVG